MAASTVLTFDVEPADGGARRPALADVGGAILQNDATHPPTSDGLMPYDDMLNEWQRQIQAQGKVAPGAIVSVAFTAGAPYILSAKGPGSAIDTAFFTPTDNGTGDTSITHVASTVPPQDCQPEASINGSTPGMIAARTIANGVRVVTYDAAGAPANLPFTCRFN